jgi:hypothetical protein
MNNGNGFEQLGADINMAQALQAVQAQASAQSAGTLADPSVSSSSSTASGPASASSMSAPIFPPEEEARGLGAAPRKIDVSHFPHYGLKRGM